MERLMPHDAPEDEELDADAKERAAGEGMLAPDEDPETWGELESEKLDDDDDKPAGEDEPPQSERDD